MTPYEIGVLLHIYVSPSAPPFAPVLERVIEAMIEEGLLSKSEDSERGYLCTEKGAAHVKQLCDLPFPIACFVDHTGKRIGA